MSQTISDTNQKQVLDLYQKIHRSRVKLVGPDGKAQNLAVSLYEFPVKLIADLCEGQSVVIIQNDAQFTTAEGARMLGVSRQFLIKLLERRELPRHMVGTHRRIYVRDLPAYKAKRDRNRRMIIDDLTRAETDNGLYDLEPPDDRRK